VSVVIVGVIQQKPVSTHASIVCDMLASENLVVNYNRVWDYFILCCCSRSECRNSSTSTECHSSRSAIYRISMYEI